MEAKFENLYHKIETRHFWFKSRRKYITGLLHDFDKESKILDIGCSSGILLNEIRDLGFKPDNLYGIDISENAIQNAKNNGVNNSYVMDAQSITLQEKFDIIIASDCLEHLENDSKALENWNNLLKPSGTLIVFVPAYMFLWSSHDEVNMHFRRYTKNQLSELLTKNNFKTLKKSYWNFFLFPLVFIVRKLENLFSKKETKQIDGNLKEPGILNSFLYHVINFENKILKHINLPVGVSVFCIATKKN